MSHLLVICPLQKELNYFLDGVKSLGLDIDLLLVQNPLQILNSKRQR